jgi:hypothetical protein
MGVFDSTSKSTSVNTVASDGGANLAAYAQQGTLNLAAGSRYADSGAIQAGGAVSLGNTTLGSIGSGATVNFGDPSLGDKFTGAVKDIVSGFSGQTSGLLQALTTNQAARSAGVAVPWYKNKIVLAAVGVALLLPLLWLAFRKKKKS